jgi:hypothetical protein
VNRVDANEPRFPVRVERKAVPRPIPSVRHQPSLQGIHVYVLKLLDEFLLTPHIEIVKARLPELGQEIVGMAER